MHLQQQINASSLPPGTAGLQKCPRQPTHGGRDSIPMEHKHHSLGRQGRGISVPGGNCSGSNSFVCRSISKSSTEKSGLSSGLQGERSRVRTAVVGEKLALLSCPPGKGAAGVSWFIPAARSQADTEARALPWL